MEIQIEALKQQEREISKELWVWETKQKKAERLLNYLDEVNRFSTKFLAEAVEKEKNQEQPDNWAWEYLVEFTFKFEDGSKVFNRLICEKTESQVSYLKSQLRDIQSQLSHQERIFARIEIRHQGKLLLECEHKNRLGCLGVYQCANCKSNYSATDNQITEISQ